MTAPERRVDKMAGAMLAISIGQPDPVQSTKEPGCARATCEPSELPFRAAARKRASNMGVKPFTHI
jgi:hypothetical protein